MAAGGGRVVWVGRVISGLVSLAFLMSAFMKMKGGAEVTEGMAHLGLAESLIVPLAILESTSRSDSESSSGSVSTFARAA